MSDSMDKGSATGGTTDNTSNEMHGQATARMQQMKEQQEQRSANEE